MHIGILTGGGDCSGLNAAIRAIVRRALSRGHQVTGIKNGWLGALKGDTMPLERRSVAGILPLGGTVLGTSRNIRKWIEEDYEKIVLNLKTARLDALIVIGGEGTHTVASHINERGFPLVGIPKTIDNDVYGTDICIGFDSAVTVVMEALDRLHSTAMSHHRVMVLEVMGRTSGWLALMGGLGGGADWIWIPEVPSTLNQLIDHLRDRQVSGRDFSIVVVAEGVPIPEHAACLRKRNVGYFLAEEIEKQTGFETRVTILGHLQRGGSPTLFDRVLATRLATRAVDCLLEGKTGIMIGYRGNRVAEIPLSEVVQNSPRMVEPHLYELAQLFY